MTVYRDFVTVLRDGEPVAWFLNPDDAQTFVSAQPWHKRRFPDAPGHDRFEIQPPEGRKIHWSKSHAASILETLGD